MAHPMAHSIKRTYFSALGGESGIWTHAPVIPVYSLSRGAPYSHLGISPYMAEMVGFEPTGTCMPTVFKTASLDHSDTSPCFRCSPLPSEGKYTKEHWNCQWFFLAWLSVFVHTEGRQTGGFYGLPDSIRSKHNVLRTYLPFPVSIRWQLGVNVFVLSNAFQLMQ